MCYRRLLDFVLATCVLALVATPTYGQQPESPEALFERAEAMYRQLEVVDPQGESHGAWDQVAKAFDDIPAFYPMSPLAGHSLWRVAGIRARQAQMGTPSAVDQERQAYLTITHLYSNSVWAPEALLRLAMLVDNNPTARTGAAELYHRLLQEYPDTPQADLARVRLTSGEIPSRSLALTQRSTKRRPRVAEAREFSYGDGSGSAVRPGAAVIEDLSLAEQVTTFELGPNRPKFRVYTDHDAEIAESGERKFLSEEQDLLTTGLGPVPDHTAIELGLVVGVREYTDATHTRIVIDLEGPIQHVVGQVKSPPRIFVDLVGAELPPAVPRELISDGDRIERVRLGVNRPGVVRVVLDLKQATPFSLFPLADPHRLVVDIPNGEISERLASARRPLAPKGDSLARQLALDVHRIVIDPGHGGRAPGAIGRTGITEKELALDISRRLAEKLRLSSEYEVLMTRSSDQSVELDERTLMANRVEADLFVSVHINSSHNRSLNGFETYFLDLATDPGSAETATRENADADTGLGSLDKLLERIVRNDFQTESRDLAQSVQDSLVMQLSKRYDEVRDLGVKQAPFVVLVGSEMPGVLVEASFLSNPKEEKRLSDPAYRDRIAEAIHIGIASYIERRHMATYSE